MGEESYSRATARRKKTGKRAYRRNPGLRAAARSLELDQADKPLTDQPLLLILNPAAGRGAGDRAGPRLERAARESGFAVELCRTEKAGDARLRAEHGVREGRSVIAVAGGDGTVSEVAAAIERSSTAMAILPVGTGNDLARHLGLPLDPVAAMRSLKGASTIRMDMGCANGTPFVLAVGTGFDAAVAGTANQGVRWARGSAAYAAALLLTLARYRPTQMRVEIDGKVFEFEGYFAVVTNARGYGGGMKIAPEASVTDGMLDVCCVRSVSKLRFIAAAGRVYSGNHVSHPAVSMHQGRSIRIDSTPPAPVVIDGELRGMTPLRIAICPAALTVVVPSKNVRAV